MKTQKLLIIIIAVTSIIACKKETVFKSIEEKMETITPQQELTQEEKTSLTMLQENFAVGYEQAAQEALQAMVMLTDSSSNQKSYKEIRISDYSFRESYGSQLKSYNTTKNFGWEGRDNGYKAFGLFTYSNGSFNRNIKTIVNISPK
ncbi:MAG: hypothetical protein SNJ71_08155 [Bacteroidales bacterium]